MLICIIHLAFRASHASDTLDQAPGTKTLKGITQLCKLAHDVLLTIACHVLVYICPVSCLMQSMKAGVVAFCTVQTENVTEFHI
jgi:hypothetical protein